MGRKGSWFSAVKKALNPDSKDKKDQKTNSKKRWFGRSKSVDVDFEEIVNHVDFDEVSPIKESSLVTHKSTPPPPPPPLPPRPAPAFSPKDDVKIAEAEDAQSKHVYSVVLATTMAAEAAVAAAQAAAEVARLTALPSIPEKSVEEVAAIKIQMAFRGHLARRALRALRGLVRLRSLIDGQSVKRQATTTLKCMQTVARVQSEIRARRIRMSEENQALYRQLQQKQEKEMKEFEKQQKASQLGDDWNLSPQSKEEVEAKRQSKQEAAMRRERALAYSFSHQKMWKNSSKAQNPTFMDASNPHWGWSWLERWMAARPWENRSTADYSERAARSTASRASMSVAEITKAYALRGVQGDNKPSPSSQKSSRPPSRQSSSTPCRVPKKNGWGGDEDSRSPYNVQSERFNRRHSFAGSSVRDNESLTSSPSVPSSKNHLTPARSLKGKSRLASLSSSGLDKNGTPTPEKGSSPSVNSVKKRLSFPASPAATRRHSIPPRVAASSSKGSATQKDDKVSNDRDSR